MQTIRRRPHAIPVHISIVAGFLFAWLALFTLTQYSPALAATAAPGVERAHADGHFHCHEYIHAYGN